MSNNTVDGKRISRPADYAAFDYTNKNQVARTSQVGKGKEEKGIDIGFILKSSLGSLYEQVRNYKEKGKAFEDVVVIKAENNIKSKTEKRDEGLTH